MHNFTFPLSPEYSPTDLQNRRCASVVMPVNLGNGDEVIVGPVVEDRESPHLGLINLHH